MSASAGVTELPRQAGLATLMKSYGSRYKDLIGNSFWQAAIAQSAVEAYDQATRGKSYLKDIAATYRTYVHGPNPISALPDFEDGYADDTAWWGLAWLQAYVITKNKDYLRVAEADANFIHRHRDKNQNSCGGSGGVWWVITGSSGYGRLAIPNALFLELTAWLHNVVHHDTKYLRWAKAEWAWLNRSGMINRHNHLVWNGFGNAPKCTIGGTYWSYDMGAVIAGLAQLYRATKKAGLLHEAEEIANATIRYLAPHGVLADQCQPRECSFDQQSFKGIFISDLRMLATIARTKAYNSFLKAQRFSVEAHDTSTGEKFGLIWAGPIRNPCPASSTKRSRRAAANVCTSYTQASAEAAVVAALVWRLARHSAGAVTVRSGRRRAVPRRTRCTAAGPPG
jgi:Glycosyl hydrolase family 76